MNKKFKRYLSVMTAFCMLFTTAFVNLGISVNASASEDEIATASAVVVEETAAEAVEAAADTEEIIITEETADAEESEEDDFDISLMSSLTAPDGYETIVSGTAVTAPVKGTSYFFDLTDGSIIPLDTDGQSGINIGMFRLTVGNQHAYACSTKEQPHGMQLKAGNEIQIDVAGPVTLSLGGCQFSNDGTITVTAANETKIDPTGYTYTKGDDGCYHNDGSTIDFLYEGEEATTLSISVSDTTYIPCILVAPYEAPVPTDAESWELWLDDIAADGTVAAGQQFTEEEQAKYGSLVLLKGKNGEDYTAYKTGLSRAGKTVNAYKAGDRPGVTKTIPTAGTAVIFKSLAAGVLKVYLYVDSGKNIQVEEYNEDEEYATTTESDNGIESLAFEVKQGYTYVIDATGTNSLSFAGISYVPDETVTISATFDKDDEVDFTGQSISLVDSDLGNTKATIKSIDEAASLKLANGHTYKLVSSTAGIKPTVDGSTEFTVDGNDIEIYLNNVSDVTLTGAFDCDDTGIADTVTKITFTSMANSDQYYYCTTDTTDTDAAGYIANGAYSIVMKPGNYNTSIETTANYTTYDRVQVYSQEELYADSTLENVNNIYLESLDTGAASYTPSTGVGGLTVNGSVTVRSDDIIFKSGTTASIPVSTESVVTVSSYYQCAYTTSADSATYGSTSGNTSQIDTVSFTVSSDLTLTFLDTYGSNYITSITVTPIVSFKSEISVPGDYDTLTEAVAAINAMDRPDGEDGRVTINLTADIQEQVLVDAPYVTINGNDHEITWYYGTTGSYYSCDSKGYYSETLFRDKYERTTASGSLWGGVVIVTGDYFKAVDTTFRNTYNYEVTDKEIEDGAYQTGLGLRTKDTDVEQYTYKERANALYTNAAHIEVYNCNILSSQDTLGVNADKAGYYAYFKDCVIGGNVDYICGGGTMVFDDCELQWKTFTQDSSGNNLKIGYLCAPKTSPYIFRNCEITQDDSSVSVSGLYGRTWGSGSTAYFVSCETNGTITKDGWGTMDKSYTDWHFYEYNNTSNGEAFATSGTYSTDQITNASTIANLTTDLLVDEYLGGWMPSIYELELNSYLDSILEANPNSWYADKKTSMTEEEIAALKIGDSDNDGRYSAADAAIALKLTRTSLAAADTWGLDMYEVLNTNVTKSANGITTTADASTILKKARNSDFVITEE